jgi:hypothetical protein
VTSDTVKRRSERDIKAFIIKDKDERGLSAGSMRMVESYLEFIVGRYGHSCRMEPE